MNSEDLILSVAEHTHALNLLPENLKSAIEKFKEEHDERIRRKQEAEKARNNEESERRLREQEEERNAFLCKGSWAENIPLNRRFVLCERDFDSPDEPKRRFYYCAIDLVRGFMSPYWGYYYTAEEFYDNRLKPLLEATDEETLLKKIRLDWNFFKICEPYDKKPFRILNYEILENGYFVVKGRSVEKTFENHQYDLKLEFCISSLPAMPNKELEEGKTHVR